MMDIGFIEHVAVHYNYLTIMEVKALKSWAIGLPPNPIAINIGAGAGTSALALLSARGDLRVVSIDIDVKKRHLERKHLEHMGIPADRCQQLDGDSTAVGLFWRPPVDLVFIDGDHHYEHVKSDIQAWLPHIKPGGVLCGHDYGYEKWAGVKQAFDEETPHLQRIGLVDHLIGFYI
jgi:predicted O-methyltransferase YrrM